MEGTCALIVCALFLVRAGFKRSSLLGGLSCIAVFALGGVFHYYSVHWQGSIFQSPAPPKPTNQWKILKTTHCSPGWMVDRSAKSVETPTAGPQKLVYRFGRVMLTGANQNAVQGQ